MKTTRKALILLAAIGLIVCASLWMGLKIGRPAYYSDGDAELTAIDLRNSGMLRWSEPQREFDIPGPVRGRVVELPDGRVLYGLARAMSVTDLVTYDPRHPADPPQPVLEINSPGHDFAPVLGSGGRLYFASDRPTGAGGFDIYTASFRDGIFFAPRPLPEGINSGLDETDPAIDESGGEIIFVRRDPEEEDGRNGKLMMASFSAPEDAKPVFPDDKKTTYRRELAPPIDRDPIVGPDGIGLYFVRQTVGEPLALMRTSWHVDHYVRPMPVVALQKGGPFRGPAVLADGFGMRLISGARVGDDSIESVGVYRSDAEQVYPFWEGQWWLEWLLLYLVLFFALLLILLTLGARWSQLDVITKLILMSVLIHLLLLLWLSGVEIIRSFEQKGPEDGAVQVHLVSQRASHGDAGASAPTQNQIDVSQSMKFEGHESALEVSGPAAEMAASQRSLETANSSARPSYTPSQRSSVTDVSDRPQEFALRSGRATEAAQDRREMSTEAEVSNRTEADRRDVQSEAIEVRVPGSDSAIAATASRRASRTAMQPSTHSARPMHAPRQSSQKIAVADTPTAPSRRANAPAAAGAASQLRALVGKAVPAAANAAAQSAPTRESSAETGVPKAAPASTSLAGAPQRRAAKTSVAPVAASAPRPRAMVAKAAPLADAPRVMTRSGGAAPAEKSLARSASADRSGLTQAPKSVMAIRQEHAVAADAVAAPSSALTAAPASHSRAVTEVSRSLPQSVQSTRATESAVAVADQVPAARDGTMRRSSAATSTKIVAKDIRAVAPAEKSPAARAERGDPTGVETAQKPLALPGSLLAREGRALAVAEHAAADSAAEPRSNREHVADVAELRDDVGSSRPASQKSASLATEQLRAANVDQARPVATVPEVQRPRGGDQQGMPAVVDLSTPGSLIERGSRRAPAVAEAMAQRAPSRRAAANPLANPVALKDDIETDRSAVGRTSARETSQKVAAAAMDRVAAPRASTAQRAQRGDPQGGIAIPSEIPTPGSLVERGSRRSVAHSDRISQRVESRSDRVDLMTDAVALRDDLGPSSESTTGGATATRTTLPRRGGMVQLQQVETGLVARPKRDQNRGGMHDLSIGIALPGSFVERAGVRQDVPVLVAQAAPVTPYSNRFGANKLAALKKYGGTKETERAVRRGLAYLARIQNANGSWGNQRGSDEKYGQVFIGKTGLCLLAFLGAGHTPDSNTEHSEVTRKALSALLRTQRESAHFGVTTAYTHGITTYALAECYAMTKSRSLRRPIERAVKWILANQNRRRDPRNRGGWGYFSSTIRAEDPYARTSVTAWQVMALESAKLSGIAVPDDALALAKSYLLGNYDRRHRYFLYNKQPSRLRSEWRTLPASTPAAIFCLQLMGMDDSDYRLEAGLDFVVDRRPRAYRRYSDDDFVFRGAGNPYFWYYSTLACFMAGGETWDRWNTSLKRVLLSGQARDGSFPIIDSYAGYAGDTDRDRSFTTAMCVLSLEVYYRYFTPLLKKGK